MGKFRKISGHVYHVENQNGFNNALYDYFGATDDGMNCTHSKKGVRKMVQNYPETYPTTIVIINQSFECSRIYIETFDLKWEANAFTGF